MSRELKFRCWFENKNVSGSNEHMIYSDENLINFFKSVYSWTSKEGRHVMQYTGLKDKNGKEIYEGDILSFEGLDKDYHGRDVICRYFETVEFYDGCFILSETGECICDHDYRVIAGNIYENPELLEATENE